MNSSVPPGSSAIETTFIVGTDLVEFDRHDLPIYATLESRWADAGLDASSHGAPLDRLFGEPGEVHVSSTVGGEQHAAAATMLAADPLVVLTGLSDGLAVPAAEPSGRAGTLEDAHGVPPSSGASGIAATFDIGIDTSVAVHSDDGSSWDPSGNGWHFDYGA
jgi:hypothetical protein